MLNRLSNKIKEALAPLGNRIREALLGKNNERLDFILDSFYKLEPKHRTSVIIGSSVALLGTFVLIFVFYSLKLML